MGVLSIGCLHQREDGLDHELRIQSGYPVLLNGLRADLSSVGFHARVIDLGDELDLGRLEGIVVREVKVNGEASTDKGSALRTLNLHVPDHHIILSGLDGDACDWSLGQVAKFLKQSLMSLSDFWYFCGKLRFRT